ncbi:MAG TPA: (2Fe-2S)-binding protein, partial [Mycobacterium sp.]|nr:(2Fe-2S)-binding protein [Mycobacterium sp.]
IDGGALRVGPLFRRRSCCLIYRIANTRTATCGDCILSCDRQPTNRLIASAESTPAG